MEAKSIEAKILYFLQINPGWVANGTIERQASGWGTNASNVNRRCRDLRTKGRLESLLVKEGKRTTVQYRYLIPEPIKLVYDYR